jgi:hypothetical protein
MPSLKRYEQAAIVGILAMSRTICLWRMSGSSRSLASA